MKKVLRVLVVCVSAAIMAMALGACSGTAQEEVKTVEGNIVAEFNTLVDEASSHLTALEAEVEKLGDEGAKDISADIAALKPHLEDAKTALINDEQAAKDAAKKALTEAEAEFAKIKTKVEDLGESAGEELKKALTGFEEGINKLKALL